MQKVTKSLSVEEARRARRWYVIDAEGKPLGRLASRVAATLRGKHNPAFTPHVDCGDFVIVVNADKVALTGNKAQGKIYYRHSGYPGGIRAETAGHMLARCPEEVVRKAVVGMLPRNRLGRQLARKLKVYSGPDHPHSAQNPQPLAL
ncbi:MAG: 50S ribosomal protein L13 [Deltaproteobacteria bacterium]|nr:MAG: 50S ribosomal protein L13 [Deltaproteobacteria bacterium]